MVPPFLNLCWGENLTNFKQKNPIIASPDPWGPDFDSTMIWGLYTERWHTLGFVSISANYNGMRNYNGMKSA